MNQIIQGLHVYLKGGQSLSIPFAAEKADVLNPQVEAFIAALGDEKKSKGNFVFQGQRVVLIHLPDISAADVVSLVRKEEKADKVEKKA